MSVNEYVSSQKDHTGSNVWVGGWVGRSKKSVFFDIRFLAKSIHDVVKKKLYFNKQQVQATVQSFKLKQLQNLQKQIPQSLSPLPFTFSPSNPQIEGAAAGRAWLWACAGKVEKRRATFVDTYARELFRVVIHLWIFDSKNGIRAYFFHFFSTNRSFVCHFPSIYLWISYFNEFGMFHSDIKFHLLDFAYFFILPGKVQFRNVN